MRRAAAAMTPTATATPPQIVFGSTSPRRPRTLPITVTDDTQLTTVKIYINNKLVSMLAPTALNLKFSQPLPNHKVVTVKVEATDAAGKRSTQQVTVSR